jgi:hypothetical protein
MIVRKMEEILTHKIGFLTNQLFKIIHLVKQNTNFLVYGCNILPKSKNKSSKTLKTQVIKLQTHLASVLIS